MTAPNTMQHLLEANAGDRQIVRGRVVLIHDDGSVSVTCDSDDHQLRCDVLQTGDRWTLQLAVDDTVLLWRPVSDEGQAVILGRIGPSHAPALESGVGVPDTLVIEAKEQLTLRVGDGSITIREDGKILIKGKDLVSHAQRMNRIKGGSVSIN